MSKSRKEANAAQCTYEVALQAFREVANAYFMRGREIQYNAFKKMGLFTPEEATGQSMNYMVCSAFTDNVYRELLDIQIPPFTFDLVDYARDYPGRPETVAYGERQADGEFKMTFYDNGKEEVIMSPTVEDIIPHLQSGDILTYTGHTIVCFDVTRDENGKVINARTMESMHGKGHTTSVVSKICSVTEGDVVRFGSANHYFYYNDGSIRYQEIAKESIWPHLREKTTIKKCSVVRFIGADENGNAVLNCLAKKYGEKDFVKEPIILNARVRDRLKYSKLYIEKTVDAFEDSVVSEGDNLTYTITVKNNSDKDYNGVLTVKEKVPKYTSYKSSKTARGLKSAKYDKKKNTVTWKISNLKAGKSVQLKYTVKVNQNTMGKTVTATGKVNNILTSKINNLVGNRLTKKQKSLIEAAYEKLKKEYTGKKLVNEIYKTALGKDLKFDKFEVTDLVIDTDKTSTDSSTIFLNKKHKFYKNVFAGYFGSLAQRGTTYDIKYWRCYDGPEPRRASNVYDEHFMTGDILLYNNSNDKTILTSGKPAFDVTCEDGEYAYIYIEGKGFVGVNLGADGKKGTKDDRNEFSYRYYEKQGKLASSSIPTEDELKKMNLMTLIGKDNYVIMRPSLTMR